MKVSLEAFRAALHRLKELAGRRAIN